MVAEDDLKDTEICEQVDISDNTLYRWKQHPVFAAEVQQQRERLALTISAFHVARKEKRMRALDDRWRRLQQVIEERAADPSMKNVPGGTTGLIVRQYKMIGAGTPDVQLVTEYVVDAPTLSELRAIEKQASQEAGQWTEKSHVTSESLVYRLEGADIRKVLGYG